MNDVDKKSKDYDIIKPSWSKWILRSSTNDQVTSGEKKYNSLLINTQLSKDSGTRENFRSGAFIRTLS